MFTGEVRAPGAPPRTLRPRRRPAHATTATHPQHTRNHLYSYFHGEQRGVVPAQLEAAPACKPPTMRCLKWRCFFCPRDFSIRGRCAQGRGRRWSEERCVEAPSSQRPKPRSGRGQCKGFRPRQAADQGRSTHTRRYGLSRVGSRAQIAPQDRRSGCPANTHRLLQRWGLLCGEIWSTVS